MPKTLSRQELYDLIWSQPTRTVAKANGISDVGLAKTCRKADIPIPPRGYWAKKEAGQNVPRTPLPLRFPGAADEFEMGVSSGSCGTNWDQDILDMPVPPVPSFSESIEALTVRVEKMVGKVPVLRDFSRAYGPISRLLGHDEERRNSQWSFVKPKYESGIERRRLLILNSIFLAVSALGCKPSLSTSKYAVESLQSRGITVSCGSQHIHFTLEQPVLRGVFDRPNPDATTLTLAFGTPGHPTSADFTWRDNGADKIERHMREIVVALLVAAETQHRESALRHRQWIIERKEVIRNERERKKAEQIRKERELKEQREKELVAALIQQATDLQMADTIRSYVRSMVTRPTNQEIPSDQLDAWAQWALQQADSIDPSNSNKFLQLVNWALTTNEEAYPPV